MCHCGAEPYVIRSNRICPPATTEASQPLTIDYTLDMIDLEGVALLLVRLSSRFRSDTLEENSDPSGALSYL